MAVITEAYGSRAKSSNTVTYLYSVVGTDDLDEVLNLIDTTAPDKLADGSARGTPSCRPHGSGSTSTFWMCEVPYSTNEKETDATLGAAPTPEPPGTGGSASDVGGNVAEGANASDMLQDLFGTSFNFSTGGGTVRIFQSLENYTNHAPIGQTPPDHKGAIGVQPDGTVEGVEVLSPKGSFSMSRKVQNLTVGYFKAAMAATARTNLNNWKGFWRTEVLFEGLDGSYRADANAMWDLTWHFGYSPATAIDLVGWDRIGKRGWHYIWFEYEDVDDAAAVPKKKTRRPFAAHVERVYHEFDFEKFRL